LTKPTAGPVQSTLHRREFLVQYPRHFLGGKPFDVLQNDDLPVFLG
jgi:hypothetical protein